MRDGVYQPLDDVGAAPFADVRDRFNDRQSSGVSLSSRSVAISTLDSGDRWSSQPQRCEASIIHLDIAPCSGLDAARRGDLPT